MPVFRYSQSRSLLIDIPLGLPSSGGGGTTPPTGLAWDYSATNVPWKSTPDTSHWPSGLTIVPLLTPSSDFYTNLKATCDAQPTGSYIIVQLPAGVYGFNSFRLIGASGNPLYSYGFWDTGGKLRGFLGAGADKTFIQMNANSMSANQLTALTQQKSADFSPLQMGLMRIDGTRGFPVYISGVTFRSAQQQDVTTKPSSTDWYNAVVPQSAPFQGLTLYSGSQYYVSDCRFQGAGRALTAAPPFEMANSTSQKCTGRYLRCEFDGRRSGDLDPNQTRVCGPVMVNDEVFNEMTECWGHHSNVSRYAANDESSSGGNYRLIRSKFDHISELQNNGNGGSGNQPSVMGFESNGALIELIDVILQQDNGVRVGSLAHHISLTDTGAHRQGGRLKVTRGVFRNNGFPVVDGYLSLRIPGPTVSYWNIDTHAVTIDVRDANDTRLTDYNISSAGAYPPSASTQASAGITPGTKYLVTYA